MANKKYKLTDGNMWATDGIHDFGQNKTQRTINSEVNTALGGKAPKNHASTSTTYGKGTRSNYGHVKISDSLTDTTPAATGGVVPSMKAVSDLNGAITHDTLHNTKTAIASDPSSIDAIKSYDVGIYRVAISGTTIFPNAYGVLEILKGQDYSTARFSTINASDPRTWRVEWNTASGNWYSNVWKDEQKQVKDYLDTSLPSVRIADVNDMGTDTVVGFVSTSTVNGPIAADGTIWHYASSANYATQLLQLVGANGIWWRYKASGTWSDWRRIDAYYKANDTFADTSSLILSGVASSTLKTLYFDVPVDKSTENISSVSVTAMRGYILGTEGRVDGSGSKNFADTSAYTTTCTKQANTHIRVALSKVDSTAFTGLSVESPVTYFGAITLTFT